MKYSKYLPINYNGEAITLIAGKGRYPALIRENIVAKNIPIKLISIKNETDKELVEKFSSKTHKQISLGHLNDLLKSLKALNSKYVILAGQIRPSKLFKGLFPDIKMVALLSKLNEVNAESIFGALINQISNIGCIVIDARSFIDDHIATIGLLTCKNKAYDNNAIEYGLRIANSIAKLNIGQGVVTKGKTIIAVEAFEGTNKMIKRVGEFKLKDLTFIKTIKEKQDFRFDIPVIGLKTLENLYASNIKTLILENESAILLDKIELLKKAEKLKIQIICK